MTPPLTRRALFVGSLLTAACGRNRGKRAQGWLCVSSGAQNQLAIADLSEFRPLATIALPHPPGLLLQRGERIFSTSHEASALMEVDSATLRAVGTTPLPGKPVAARLSSDGATAVILTVEPGFLLLLDLGRTDSGKHRIAARLALPDRPVDIDVSPSMAAITLQGHDAILRVSLPSMKIAGSTPTGASCTALRFRNDGRTILAAAPASRQILTVNAESGALLARLNLPIAPTRFCFNPDGGQMFVTGSGEDAVSIVSPYQNQVGETMLAGHKPAEMTVAARQNLLLVTNPESGDLTILDIDTRHLAASVHIGETPGEVLVTPDGEYALVIDRNSGNVSVLRIATVIDHKVRTKPLFTVFPTAAQARSAIIIPAAS